MELLTLPQAAEVLNVRKRRIHDLARSEGLPLVRLSEQQYRVDREALTEWVRARTKVAPTDESSTAGQ